MVHSNIIQIVLKEKRLKLKIHCCIILKAAYFSEKNVNSIFVIELLSLAHGSSLNNCMCAT